MKYCAKCGTQMSDEAVACPQCQTPPNIQHTQNFNPKPSTQERNNKTNLLITINIILTVVLLITFIAMYFPLTNDSTNNYVSSSKNSTSGTVTSTSTCPANEYGNHNWSRATCQEPSYCYDCHAEKDGKLGNHSWDVDELGNRYCWDCGIPYSD